MLWYISCSTCEKKEKKAFGLFLLLSQSCCNFNLVVIYTLFPRNSNYKMFGVHKKSFIPSLIDIGMEEDEEDQGQDKAGKEIESGAGEGAND